MNDAQTTKMNLEILRDVFIQEMLPEILNPQVDFSSKTMLRNYLYSFNCKQLKIFIRFVIQGRREARLFISNVSSFQFWTTIGEECRKKNPTDPRLQAKYLCESFGGNSFYFFDYLSKKKIAEIFCDHIDKDIKLAEKAAHIFCKSGIKEAGEYVNAELRRCQQ